MLLSPLRLSCASAIVAMALSGCTLNTQGAGEPFDPDAALSDAASDVRADACGKTTKLCDSECVEFSDPAYGCSSDKCSPCSLAHATARCSGLHCAIQTCDDGWGDCNGDHDDGCETDLHSLYDCGACGQECFVAYGSASCSAGVCAIASCNDGFADCNSVVADGCEASLSSVAHCGECGKSCAIDGGGQPACDDGVCGLSNCPVGFLDCNGLAEDGCETDVTTIEHCGACNVGCAMPHAAAACVEGACAIGQCEAPFEDCDEVAGNGCEVDTSNSTANCGSCGGSCSSWQGTNPICTEGKCSLTCNDDFADCNGPAPGASDDGCEGDLLAGAQSCGACGRACSATGVFESSCDQGVCTSTCVLGRGNCVLPAAPDADDGCETDVTKDTSNCGACAATCDLVNATDAHCAAGACTFSCQQGFADCNGPKPGLLDDGCEVNLLTDLQHCGSCDSGCPLENADSASCDQGKCVYTCSPGWGDCNGPHPGSSADGCEHGLAEDLLHCGGCGHACSKTHASDAVCAAGLCVPSCEAGWFDCDTPAVPLADDGCESNPLVDPKNCSGCGLRCGTDHVAQNLCSAGACAPACELGWGDCDKAPASVSGNNGCEVNIYTNTTHCGACGRGCSGDHVDDKSCSGGRCDSSCNFSWMNCSKPGPGSSDDGCETFGLVCF